MRGKRYLYMMILLLCFTAKTKAQDHIYSQFFNAPIYFNPALTGQFEGDLRANFIYRNQWSGLYGDVSYYSASVDVNIPQFGGGFGLMFTRGVEGTAYLAKNNIAATYAYSVGGDDFVTSFGLQAGFTNRQIDVDKLVFGDQIDPSTGYVPGSVSAAQLPDISRKFFFDAAAGINIVYKKFLVGFATHHLNQPDESFTEMQAKLPIRYTANASLRIPLSEDYGSGQGEGSYFLPSVNYSKQVNASSLSLGGQVKFRSINLGVWYRANSGGQSDAVVASFVFDIFSGKRNGEKIRLGISHDATTSEINYTNTSGTTEASVAFQKYFRNSDGYNKFNGLRCYDFY